MKSEWLERAPSALLSAFRHQVANGLIAHQGAVIANGEVRLDFPPEGIPAADVPNLRAVGMALHIAIVQGRGGVNEVAQTGSAPRMLLRRPIAEGVLTFGYGSLDLNGERLSPIRSMRVAAEMCCGMLVEAGVLHPDLAEHDREDFTQLVQELAASYNNTTDLLREELQDVLWFGPSANAAPPQVANG